MDSKDQKVTASVVILNYRRREDAARAIESALAQTYEPKEVILVDNASGDGTAEFLSQRFPNVKILASKENLGCAGRNLGIQNARGDIVVTIDNDVYFETPGELERVIKAFELLPEASCIIFKILRADNGKLHVRDWCHPRDYSKFSDECFETWFIPEGASAFRRRDFLELGGYWEPLWIGCEGWDLSLRMLNAGKKMYYRPEVRVRHAMSHETRGSGRNYYYYTRNYILIAFKDYSGWRRWQYLSYNLGMLLWFTLRTRFPNKFVAGIRDGIRNLHALKPTPVSEYTFVRLKELNRYRPGIIDRFRRHWAKPLI